jgi:hypothetical protein
MKNAILSQYQSVFFRKMKLSPGLKINQKNIKNRID